MEFQAHCPGCFARKHGVAVCPACGYDEGLPRSPVFIPHGVVLGGQYRVGRVLGRPGGFGITYLGWDIHLHQRVAIKEYLPRELAARGGNLVDVTVYTEDDRGAFDSGREQFLREARTVARLDHPNIVRVRAYFNANGTAYLVMDYYEGMSLGDYLSSVKHVLPVDTAINLALPLLDGLAYVHAHGVVHRDVKPHNIYFANTGRPILLDFGAARLAAQDQAHSMWVGVTEGYAPREQYQRRNPQGPWTDVYGLAATVYRMLVGVPPPVALDRIGQEDFEPEAWTALPAPLREVLSRALAVHPERRYASAAAFAEALRALREGETPTSAPPLDLPWLQGDRSRADPEAITAEPGNTVTEPRAPTTELRIDRREPALPDRRAQAPRQSASRGGRDRPLLLAILGLLIVLIVLSALILRKL
jgi:serine/threonine protein kinase